MAAHWPTCIGSLSYLSAADRGWIDFGSMGVHQADVNSIASPMRPKSPKVNLG